MSHSLASVFHTPIHLQRIKLAQVLSTRFPTLHLTHLTTHALSLHTILRDERTPTAEFVRVADQLLKQLVEHALDTLPTKTVTVTTPTQVEFVGCALEHEVCGVSIVRAGESMESALRSILPGVRIGKILIQRDEASKEKNAQFFYSKLPPNVNECHILLLDPMLASGGSSICAVKHLVARGISLARITFVCLIASPEGIEALLKEFPTLSLVAGILDQRIDERKYIIPGVGDFGDRYFGTVETHQHDTTKKE